MYNAEISLLQTLPQAKKYILFLVSSPFEIMIIEKKTL